MHHQTAVQERKARQPVTCPGWGEHPNRVTGTVLADPEGRRGCHLWELCQEGS